MRWCCGVCGCWNDGARLSCLNCGSARPKLPGRARLLAGLVALLVGCSTVVRSEKLAATESTDVHDETIDGSTETIDGSSETSDGAVATSDARTATDGQSFEAPAPVEAGDERATPVDAGSADSAGCTPSSCGPCGAAAPYPCCKTDGTCGCQWFGSCS